VGASTPRRCSSGKAPGRTYCRRRQGHP
jgi:hypothetical protein